MGGASFCQFCKRTIRKTMAEDRTVGAFPAEAFRQDCISRLQTRLEHALSNLDMMVRNIKSRLPHAGYRTVKGCLQSEGHRVQWARVRASMHRVDTAGILLRLSSMGCVIRRKYSVPGPLCMQHIDTNHKLIRYNIVVFGGIDGFSRKIMYLNAASNNKASTAYAFFLDGVRRFGWPKKVRADQGVENVDIAQAMFTVRGTGCGSFISGKSVHNQRFFYFCRIERLWRDVWLAVTQVYYDVLHTLEEDGLLDIADSLHLYCVHYSFLPRLKDDLSRFARGWDDHPVRTEQNMTPNQLWHLGLMQNPVGEPGMSEGIHIDAIDWEDSGLDVEEHQGVILPGLECPLNPRSLELLRLAVQPTASSDSYGRDIYLNCLHHASYLLDNQ
ncbi:uncharacterized protein LOC143527165 isoform X3 [Brachyhypopomus gauderio]|uniref:uncharacterized protein LOC143488809 isoform X3 n=1 Tax=Brachyhypopomus gauderio TaxID=698409 RepID=UPI004042AF0D